MRGALVDTGPLVALLDRRDAHHAWARELLDTVQAPMRTCEAVVSEACFLLRSFRVYRKHGRQAVPVILPE